MSKKKYVYYFTYGSDKAESGHPYEGGWSVVEAPSMGAAAEIFRAIHPDKHPGRLNCCSVYSSEGEQLRQGLPREDHLGGIRQ